MMLDLYARLLKLGKIYIQAPVVSANIFDRYSIERCFLSLCSAIPICQIFVMF